MKKFDCNQLALQKVKINGNITGKFGTFDIEQTFKNDTKNVLEVGYTFPVVDSATVTGFTIYIGDKILEGKCKETAKAKKEYAKNIVKGNSAYLLEKAAGNVFNIAVGKLDKNEEVKIVIHYIDKFDILDNQINVLIPTLVFPRYKSQTTENLQYGGEIKYTVDFNINISQNLNVKNI